MTTRVLAFLAVAAVPLPGSHSLTAQETAPAYPTLPVRIEGVLLDEAGAPLADRLIYLLDYWTSEQLVELPGGVQAIQHSETVNFQMLEDADGKLTISNARATTDAAGAFVFDLPAVALGTQFALGTIAEERAAAFQRSADGSTVVVALDTPTTTVNLGQVVTRTQTPD